MFCETKSDLYSQRLILTLVKYHEGCTQNSISDLKDPTVLIERALAEELISRFSASDREVLKSFSLARTQGLAYIHQENFCDAESAFVQASEIIQMKESSDECKLLCKSFLGQSQSYLDYRKSDFNEACNRITTAIDCDVILESQYGYQSLFLHRVHLVHNLVRIYAKNDRLEDAIKLSCEVLNYLGGFSNKISVRSEWSWQTLSHQTHEHIAILFNGIVNELAIVLSGQENLIQQSLFANISKELLSGNSQKGFCYSLKNWLSLKKAFINRDVDTFLSLIPDFLIQQKAKNPILWYTAIIDLLTICHELNSQTSNLLKKDILKSALSLIVTEHLPSKLYHLLTNFDYQKDSNIEDIL